MSLSDNKRLEDTIDALEDELNWTLRYYYAAKAIFETDLRITRSLFDTFYFSCIDQSGLILSRIILADNASINLHYLGNQAQDTPSSFHYAKPGEIAALIREQTGLFDAYKPLIDILKEQRDRNLAHLDRHHINDPEWRKTQGQIDFLGLESLLKALIGILATYHRLFHGGESDFGDWETASRAEVQDLIKHYEAFQSKD